MAHWMVWQKLRGSYMCCGCHCQLISFKHWECLWVSVARVFLVCSTPKALPFNVSWPEARQWQRWLLLIVQLSLWLYENRDNVTKRSKSSSSLLLYNPRFQPCSAGLPWFLFCLPFFHDQRAKSKNTFRSRSVSWRWHVQTLNVISCKYNYVMI